MSFEEEFDRIIRQKAEELDYPFDEKNWERASNMLDDQERYTVAAPARVYLPAALVIAAGTAAFFTLAYLGKPEAKAAAEIAALQQPLTPETVPAAKAEPVSRDAGYAQAAAPEAVIVTRQQPDASAEERIPGEPGYNSSQGVTAEPAADASNNKNDREATGVTVPPVSATLPVNEESSESTPVQDAVTIGVVEAEDAAASYFLLFPVNSQLPASPERDLVLAEVSLPASYDDYFRKHRKLHWAAAEAGTAYGLGWNGTSGTDARGFNWYAGVGYGLYLGNKAGVSIGAQLGNIRHIDQPFYAASGKDYGFGSTSASTLITVTELCYASVPLRFHFFPAGGHEFAAGLHAAKVIHASNRIDTFAVQNDLPVRGSISNTGIYEGIAPYNLQLSLSYRLSLCRRMAVRVEYLHGLTDIYKTDYSAGKKEQSRLLRLGIQYLMFDK